MNSTITRNVGGFAPAISHVPATSVYAGVINADPRLRRATGEVCLLTQSPELQGTTVSAAAPVTDTPFMVGTGFDKYRTGSHVTGLTG